MFPTRLREDRSARRVDSGLMEINQLFATPAIIDPDGHTFQTDLGGT